MDEEAVWRSQQKGALVVEVVDAHHPRATLISVPAHVFSVSRSVPRTVAEPPPPTRSG
jgi:hypothetical protein